MYVELGALLMYLTLSQVLGWRPFTVEFRNVSYEVFHPDIIYLNITLKNKTMLDVHISVVRQISQLFIDFVLFHDSGNDNYDLVYANKTVDYCMFLNKRKLNVFFNIIYKMLSAHGEQPKGCPLRKKHYKFINVIVDPEKYPPFMPDHKAFASNVVWNKENGKRNVLLTYSVYIITERSYKNNAKGLMFGYF